MNDYYIRCVQTDVPSLYTLAQALGVLTPIPDTDQFSVASPHLGAWDVLGEIQAPTGATYSLPDTQYPETVPVTTHVLDDQGVPVLDENGQPTTMTLYQETGKMITIQGQVMQVTAPVSNAHGVPYWHANLRINADLSELAAASTNPLVQAGLADLARWFVVGEDGKAVQPSKPARVWL